MQQHPMLPGPIDDWLGDLLSPITDAAANAAEGVLDAITDRIQESLSALGSALAGFIDSAGDVDFTVRDLFGQGGVASSTIWLGLAMVLFATFLQAAKIARDGGSHNGGLSQMAIDFPVTLIGTVSVVSIGSMVLSITDAAGQWMLRDGYGALFASSFEFDPTMPWFLRLLLGLLLVLLSFVLYIELLVRSHLTTVLLLMMPIGIGLRVWEPARYIAQAMVRFFLAMAMLPMLLGLSVRVAASANSRSGAVGLDIEGALLALAGMAVTTLMPFLVVKVFPVGDGGISGAGLGAIGAAAGAATFVGGALALGGGAAGAVGGASGSGFGSFPPAGGGGGVGGVFGAATGGGESSVGAVAEHASGADSGSSAGPSEVRSASGAGGGDGSPPAPSGGPATGGSQPSGSVPPTSADEVSSPGLPDGLVSPGGGLAPPADSAASGGATSAGTGLGTAGRVGSESPGVGDTTASSPVAGDSEWQGGFDGPSSDVSGSRFSQGVLGSPEGEL